MACAGKPSGSRNAAAGAPDAFGLRADVERRHAQTGPPGLGQAEAPGLRKDRRQQRERRVLRLDQGHRLVGRIAAGDEDAPGREQPAIVDRVADHDELQRQAPFRGIARAVEHHLITLVDADRADDADAARGVVAAAAAGRRAPHRPRAAAPSDATAGKCRRMRAAVSSDGTITRRAPANSLADRRRSAATVMSSSIRLPASATHASQCATVRFAAIALRRADQRDAAAQPGIVVHMHVVRHAEAARSARAPPDDGRPDGAAR